jgi:hypothetical protein
VVRSGHARGKDFVSAVAALCHLFLVFPSKTILTAPTQRQVGVIMMSEISAIYNKAEARMQENGLTLGANFTAFRVTFSGVAEHFLIGFKAHDKRVEAWSGIHSENIMVIITEASGLSDLVFNAIEGVLTGNSRLVVVGNHNNTTGEFDRAFKTEEYAKFTLNCLDAPNVLAKRVIFPGQVDYTWVNERVKKLGWTTQIPKTAVDKSRGDFEWEGKWYRPSDLCRVRVLGLPPEQDERCLVPMAWIAAAVNRWHDRVGKMRDIKARERLVLGVDVAGMGRDLTVFAERYGTFVPPFTVRAKQDHMVTVGETMNFLKGGQGSHAYVDALGEGAAVVSRLKELTKQVTGFKGSESGKYFTDSATRERQFANLRAYCFWALRDALDPALGADLAIPPDDALIQELTETKWEPRGSGAIIIEPKEALQERIGRSPDRADALSMTFAPSFKMETAEVGGFGPY